MPSLDVVSKVDVQSLDNAANNVKREVATRFDFRNIKTEIILDRKAKLIHVISGDEWKVKTVGDMLISQCIRQKVDPKSLKFGKIETNTTTSAKMDIEIVEGISRDIAQKMVKFIKETRLKIQPAIQEEQVRISGKQIDDLQEIMHLLKGQDFGIPLQFVNLKR